MVDHEADTADKRGSVERVLDLTPIDKGLVGDGMYVGFNDHPEVQCRRVEVLQGARRKRRRRRTSLRT